LSISAVFWAADKLYHILCEESSPNSYLPGKNQKNAPVYLIRSSFASFPPPGIMAISSLVMQRLRIAVTP
jgi:hypothetical protein